MRSSTRRLKELVIFAVLGAIIFISYIALYGIPNVGFIGMLIATYTITYRVKALIPMYVYIALYGVFFGFVTMIPFLFVWLPLWGMFMIAGKFNLSVKVKVPLFMVLCALHGLSFGTLYAPFSSLLFGIPFRFQTLLAWVIAGLKFDITHALGNLAAGVLIVPLSMLLIKLNSQVIQNSNVEVIAKQEQES